MTEADRLRVGTSGWQYRDWRPSIYPKGIPQRSWLEHYARMFSTVEVNNSFYRLPTAETFERWASTTPPGFCFAVKASRYLTHVRRLQNPQEPIARLLGVARELGQKLGPILVQLPPHFECQPDRLAATLDAFGTTPVAVELRDDRWQRDEVYEILRRHNAALVWWDRRGVHGPLIRTADWVYLRLHEGRGRLRPSYGRTALTTWFERISSIDGVGVRGWVYFNNDQGAAAPADAKTFLRIAEAHELQVRRSTNTQTSSSVF